MSDDNFYASAREMAGDYAEDLDEARTIIRDLIDAPDNPLERWKAGDRASAFPGDPPTSRSPEGR